MTQYPPYTSGPVGLRAHRGTMILVFGILGLVVCVIFGIFAWVMGSADLHEMNVGRMDPTGRSMTQAGQILGIVSVGLAALGMCLAVPFVMLGVFAP